MGEGDMRVGDKMYWSPSNIQGIEEPALVEILFVNTDKAQATVLPEGYQCSNTAKFEDLYTLEQAKDHLL